MSVKIYLHNKLYFADYSISDFFFILTNSFYSKHRLALSFYYFGFLNNKINNVSKIPDNKNGNSVISILEVSFYYDDVTLL